MAKLLEQPRILSPRSMRRQSSSTYGFNSTNFVATPITPSRTNIPRLSESIFAGSPGEVKLSFGMIAIAVIMPPPSYVSVALSWSA
jgi:hypothetical protein